MLLIRKYKIFKITNTAINGEEGKIFRFIDNWFKDLNTYTLSNSYITFVFYMDKNNNFVFSRETSLNNVNVRSIGLSDVLVEDYKIPKLEAEKFFIAYIKDKFKVKINTLSFTYRREHQIIEEDYKKYRNESNQKI